MDNSLQHCANDGQSAIGRYLPGSVRQPFFVNWSYCKSRIFRTHSIFVSWGLRPFVRMTFRTVADRCGFSALLCTFCICLIFVRKPPRTKYTKITCIRNFLNLQHEGFFPSLWELSLLKTPVEEACKTAGTIICTIVEKIRSGVINSWGL